MTGSIGKIISIPGNTGPTGPPGAQGVPGQGLRIDGTADPLPAASEHPSELWVDGDGSFWVSTGSEWTPTDVQGPAGTAGAEGSQGEQGIQGVQGIQGEPGVTGSQGIQGPPGAQGNPGADGADGADGAQGATGEAGPSGASNWDEIVDKPTNLITGYANGTPVAWKLDVLSEEQYQALTEADPSTVYFRLG